jgi:DNA-binding NtrC family response regulator
MVRNYVLVVDASSYCPEICRMVEEFGWKAFHSESSEAATALIRNITDKILFAIVDTGMLERDRKLIREVRKTVPELKVLLVGNKNSKAWKDAIELGVNWRMSTPFITNDLKGVSERLLEEEPASRKGE